MAQAKNVVTKARLKALYSPPEIVVVSAGRALTQADCGKVLKVTAALTVTIPQDTLSPDFRCEFIAPSGVNLSVDPLGTVNLNGAGATLTRARASNPCTVFLQADNSANAFLMSGA